MSDDAFHVPQLLRQHIWWWAKPNVLVDKDRDISIANALMNRGERGLLVTVLYLAYSYKEGCRSFDRWFVFRTGGKFDLSFGTAMVFLNHP